MWPEPANEVSVGCLVLFVRYTPIEVAGFAQHSPGRELGMREGDVIECVNNIMVFGEKSLTHLKEVVGAFAQAGHALVVMVRGDCILWCIAVPQQSMKMLFFCNGNLCAHPNRYGETSQIPPY